MDYYPYFPNTETVAPPTGTLLFGPYISHTVKASNAFLGSSQNFTGRTSHSFQLKNKREKKLTNK